VQEASAESVDDFIIMTEAYPPLNFEQEGKLQGIAVDIMVLMLEKLGSTLTREDIQLLAWARGYEELQKQEHTCLFSTTKTAERTPLFKWVGPILTSRNVLIARKDRHISIQSIEDLKNYEIGVVINDIGEQLLLQSGFEIQDLQRVGGTDATRKNILKLNAGRIDLWSYGEIVANWELKSYGFKPNEYETVYVLAEGDLYFAFHKNTSDALIQQMQTTLDELRREGEIQKIIEKYINIE
jgi:polar amino acid transport system substrate-binding protein